MKKMKKFLSMLLAMAMVLGMSVTTFAAEVKSATITVNGGGENAKYGFVQIIEPDETEKTGWKFSNATYEGAFKTAFKKTDAQEIIQDMLDNTGLNNAPGFDTCYRVALQAISSDITANLPDNKYTATKAGVYVVKVLEGGVNYSPSAAYVEFKTYTNGVPTALQDVSVYAKKENITLEKDNQDTDNIVALDDEIVFEIKTTVPYIDPSKTEGRAYYILDKITGAEYIETGYTIQMKENGQYVDIAGKTIDFGGGDAKNTFSIDLSSLVRDLSNPNAGKEILITYKAKITDIDSVKNEAKATGKNDWSDSTFGGGAGKTDETLHTGKITVTKTSEDLNVKLAGAKFNVYLKGEGTTRQLVTVKKNPDGTYTCTGLMGAGLDGKWSDDVKTANEIEVGNTGNLLGVVTVKGLHMGTYVFDEVKAPEGYHIGKNSETEITLVLTTGNATQKEVNGASELAATDDVEVSKSIQNSRLTSLPSTGGIGTTIFTIGGCAIMIIAAGLYFSLRRKAER